MTPGCITQRLQMGTKTYLSPLLYWRGGSEGSTGAPANETTSRFTKKRLWLTHELLSEVIRRGRWKRLLTANMVGFTTAIVHVTVEEEVVLLYALYACGRKPSKARATHFIMSNHLMKEREGDSDVVSTGESKVENRIAWTRENLKRNGGLSMPAHGTWAITQKGVERIEKIALGSLTWEERLNEVRSEERRVGK